MKLFAATLIASVVLFPAATCWPDSGPADVQQIVNMEIEHIASNDSYHPFLRSGCELVSLCLHHVGTGGILSADPDQIRSLIMYFADNGYTFVDANDLVVYDNALNPAPKKMVMFSFDDGYEDNYTKALPIFEDYGVKATFFISTGKLGEPGYLTREQVSDMARRGFAIGSHTVSHIDLSSVSMGVVDAEMSKSKEVLEEIIGKPVLTFAYPGGEINSGVVEAAKKYYSLAFLATHNSKTEENQWMINRWGVFDYNWTFDSIINNPQEMP